MLSVLLLQFRDHNVLRNPSLNFWRSEIVLGQCEIPFSFSFCFCSHWHHRFAELLCFSKKRSEPMKVLMANRTKTSAASEAFSFERWMHNTVTSSLQPNM